MSVGGSGQSDLWGTRLVCRFLILLAKAFRFSAGSSEDLTSAESQGGIRRLGLLRALASELEDSTCLIIMFYSVALLQIRMIIDTFLILSIGKRRWL